MYMMIIKIMHYKYYVKIEIINKLKFYYKVK